MNKYTQAIYDLYIERSLHIPTSKEYIKLTKEINSIRKNTIEYRIKELNKSINDKEDFYIKLMEEIN